MRSWLARRGSGGEHAAATAGRVCAKCSQPLQAEQDWCLQCGAGAPGSLAGGPGWRTAAAILLATVLLIAGASVAAYAALEKKGKPVVVAKTSPATTPGALTPGATTPGASTTPIPTVPSTPKATPPKIPLQAPTPESSGGEDAEANETLFPAEGPEESSKAKSGKPSKKDEETGETGTGQEGSQGASETKTGSEKESPSPILLDTDAASVYNPYTYPTALFGDPSLGIDGEAKTAWTAQLQATSAPKMAEGLLLDLKSPQKLGSTDVRTATVGITVEVYATNAHTLPSTITDPAWKRLVGLKVLGKKNTHFPLKTHGKAYRYVVLWLLEGQPSSTATDPGSVSINEFELFPPS